MEIFGVSEIAGIEIGKIVAGSVGGVISFILLRGLIVTDLSIIKENYRADLKNVLIQIEQENKTFLEKKSAAMDSITNKFNAFQADYDTRFNTFQAEHDKAYSDMKSQTDNITNILKSTATQTVSLAKNIELFEKQTKSKLENIQSGSDKFLTGLEQRIKSQEDKANESVSEIDKTLAHAKQVSGEVDKEKEIVIKDLKTKHKSAISKSETLMKKFDSANKELDGLIEKKVATLTTSYDKKLTELMKIENPEPLAVINNIINTLGYLLSNQDYFNEHRTEYKTYINDFETLLFALLPECKTGARAKVYANVLKELSNLRLLYNTKQPMDLTSLYSEVSRLKNLLILDIDSGKLDVDVRSNDINNGEDNAKDSNVDDF